MKHFNPINREYVNPVDLNILSNSVNTLEQGHKEAIQQASALKTAISQLDLNEKEDEWKANKINEIQQEIDDNTVYGNSYAALDDIIRKAGDINSDVGLIGRLETQKAYKDYINKVNSTENLSEEAKQMFIELNPYDYKETVDKNGKVVSYQRWSPKATPIKPINLTKDVIIPAIQLTAPDKGGYSRIEYLDKNGNITTDITKADTVNALRTVDGKWERVPPEKLWASINSVMANTPMAYETLNQDFAVAKWQHSKAKANKKDTDPPVISEVTDENGRELNEQEYFVKRFAPMVAAASYNNNFIKMAEGKGLAEHKAKIAAREYLNSVRELPSSHDYNTKIKTDFVKDFTNTKNITGQTIAKIINSKGYKFIPTDENIEQVEAILKDGGDKFTNEEKATLMNAYKLYNEAKKNLNDIKSIMNEKDKNLFDFANRLQNGGDIINSDNGGNEFDNKAINLHNELFHNQKEYKINVSDEFIATLGANGLKALTDLGATINNNVITLYSNNNMADNFKIASMLKENTSKSNKGFFKTLFNVNRPEALSSQFENYDGTPIKQTDDRVADLFALSRFYDNINKKQIKLGDKYQTSPTNINLPNENLRVESMEIYNLQLQRDAGQITTAEYNQKKEDALHSLYAHIANDDMTQYKMYVTYGDEHSSKELVTDTKEAFHLGTLIKEAAKKEDLQITLAPSANLEDPIYGSPQLGYNLSIPYEHDGKTEFIQVWVKDLRDTNEELAVLQNPSFITNKTLTVLNNTGIYRTLNSSIESETLGEIGIKGNKNNTYDFTIFGNTYTVDNTTAYDLMFDLKQYQDNKYNFVNSNATETSEEFNKNMNRMVYNISSVTGLDPNDIAYLIKEDVQQSVNKK